MTFLILLAAAIFGCGGILLLSALITAPHGYQDENGFHFGPESEPVPVEADCGHDSAEHLAGPHGWQPSYAIK